MAKTSKDTITSISVATLNPDPEQPRTHINQESLQELANSIKAQGLLYPILYREVANEDGETKFVIVDGERRWRAYKEILELKEIKAIKFEGDHEAVALIGNIVREDLTAMEEAIAVNKLKAKSEGKLTNVQLGNMLGKAESTISEILALVKLPDYIQDVAKENREWSRSKLLQLTKKRKDRTKKALFDRMKKEISLEKNMRGPRKNKIDITNNYITVFKHKLSTIQTDEKWTSEDKSALKPLLEALNAEICKMLETL